MKYNGRYEFAGHTYPGRVPTYLKYAGENQKIVLTKQARKAGAKVLNRVSVFDLVADGGIVGALGIHAREKKLIQFRAKTVILGTGSCRRLYPGPTPAWMSNLSHPFTDSGDGRAMAYRAGAELVSMEVLGRHAGPKYFARCGQATWVGVLKDAYGNPVGPFLSKPDKRYGDMTTELKKTLFEDYARSGKGPVYMDCSGISDEDYEYMLYWLKQEGNTALVNHMKEEGIDPRKNPIEWMTYEIKFGFPVSGLYVNEKAETSMKGLYAAGDESFGGISGAAVFGWIAGENAARYSRDAEGGNAGILQQKIAEREAFLEDILARENGADWREVNIALQQVMYDYAGYARSETMLKAGLSHLKRLKEKAGKIIKAGNQHELMRCLEVLNLMDVGEAVFHSARERKESRGMHFRPDYPYTNPLLNKLLIIKQENSKPVIEWRNIAP